MEHYARMMRKIKSPEAVKRFTHLYGRRSGVLVSQIARYTQLVKRHEEAFGAQKPLLFVSAPGRTELAGNHTDHNNGCVLAGAVNLDTVAVVSPRADGRVRIQSEGYPDIDMTLDGLAPVAAERGKTPALVRGVAARMKELGYVVGGFEAAVTSNVLNGSGLSSSAAVEVLICAVLDALYNGWKLSGVQRAQIAQYAENEYFGKPCGLMDQMASSVGGLVFIDFRAEPVVRTLSYDFAAKGYCLSVVGTGGSHDGLTDYYAAIRREMCAVAAFFGEDTLRRVRPEQMWQELPALRKAVGERAVLRAMHFFTENRRAKDMTAALLRDDLPAFLSGVIASGESSFMHLQNVYATPERQELSLALMMARYLLAGKGAWRVHGGGFAGTTLNFVPDSLLDSFTQAMDAVFGEHACMALDIRPEGAAMVFGAQ